MINNFFTSIIFLIALLFLFPFYWMITGAFKSQTAVLASPPQWIPLQFTFDNFIHLFANPAGTWFVNSVFVSGLTTALVCVICAMAGYALAKKDFPGKNIIFWLLIGVMAIPKNTSLVPLFILIKDLKMVDTFAGLMLPFLAWPFGIFLMKQFSQTIPMEILEAAKIDGSSEFTTFRKIVLPLLKPGIAALSIFCFKTSWNDYFWQLIVIKSTAMKTLPLGVAGLQEEFGIDYGLLMAGSVLASIPIILLFFSFQSYFMKGITMGAVKG